MDPLLIRRKKTYNGQPKGRTLERTVLWRQRVYIHRQVSNWYGYNSEVPGLRVEYQQTFHSFISFTDAHAAIPSTCTQNFSLLCWFFTCACFKPDICFTSLLISYRTPNLLKEERSLGLNYSVCCFTSASVSEDDKIRNLKNPYVEVEVNGPPMDSVSFRDFLKANGEKLFEVHIFLICIVTCSILSLGEFLFLLF